MTTLIETVKEIMTENKKSFDSMENVEAQIVKGIIDGANEKQLMSFIAKQTEKGKTSEEAIVKYAKHLVKKSNRTMHTFESADALNDFCKENECGESWLTKTGFAVYKY